MEQIILLIHVIISIFLIVLVLLQHGKGADIGAAFGSGASQTIFGSQGSGGFLMKLTGGLAAAFFATSLILGYLAAHQHTQKTFLGEPVNSQTVPANDLVTKKVDTKTIQKSETTTQKTTVPTTTDTEKK